MKVGSQLKDYVAIEEENQAIKICISPEKQIKVTHRKMGKQN